MEAMLSTMPKLHSQHMTAGNAPSRIFPITLKVWSHEYKTYNLEGYVYIALQLGKLISQDYSCMSRLAIVLCIHFNMIKCLAQDHLQINTMCNQYIVFFIYIVICTMTCILIKILDKTGCQIGTRCFISTTNLLLRDQQSNFVGFY